MYPEESQKIIEVSKVIPMLMQLLWDTNKDIIFKISKDLSNKNIIFKCPSNRCVTLGEAKCRVCGLSNREEIENSNFDDVENSISVLKIFRNI